MRLVLVALVLAGTTGFAAGCSTTAAPHGPAPDLVIVDARVYTVDAACSTAEAVAITGGRFSAVGTSNDIRQLAGPSTRVIDARSTLNAAGLTSIRYPGAPGAQYRILQQLEKDGQLTFVCIS